MTPNAKPSRDAAPNLAPRSVGVTEAARLLGCSPRSIWRLVSTGDISTVRIGRRTLITVNSIDTLVERGGTR